MLRQGDQARCEIVNEREGVRHVRIAVSADGFVATPDGRPALLSMPGFVPGESHGHAEVLAQCDAVVMGRTSFDKNEGDGGWGDGGEWDRTYTYFDRAWGRILANLQKELNAAVPLP